MTVLIDTQTTATSPAPLQGLVKANEAYSTTGSCYHIANSGIAGGGFYIVWQGSWGTIRLVDSMPSASQQEIEFQQQKDAFLDIPPQNLAQYQDQYVVSHNGEILDHDQDLPTLTARFFTAHGDIPVYISKVGQEEDQWIVTPLF